MNVWEITRRQKDGGAEQSHLFISELQAAETFSQVEHGTDQVITPCTNAGGQRRQKHGNHWKRCSLLHVADVETRGAC